MFVNNFKLGVEICYPGVKPHLFFLFGQCLVWGGMLMLHSEKKEKHSPRGRTWQFHTAEKLQNTQKFLFCHFLFFTSSSKFLLFYLCVSGKKSRCHFSLIYITNLGGFIIPSLKNELNFLLFVNVCTLFIAYVTPFLKAWPSF